jgi:hypothetical protein
MIWIKESTGGHKLRWLLASLVVAGLVAVGCGGGDKYAACSKSVAPTLRAVGALNSRLDVGLNQDEYSRRVGDVKVVFDRIDRVKLTSGCDKAATELGYVVDAYAQASSEWNDCIQSDYCSDPPVQKYWDKAAGHMGRVKADLVSLKAA